MRYVLQVVLSNAQHPEYGQATIPFPIPNQNYDSTIELLGPLEIGDTLRQDCQVDELDSFYTVLNTLIGTQVTLDELDYVDKREIVSVDFTPVIHENMNTPEPSRKDGSDQRLFQKLEQEYLAYLEPLRSAALSELLEKAGEIADTQAVYRCLCENTGLSTEQKEKLATLEQPLQAIRDRWRQTHPTPEPELLEACEALTTSQQQSEETPALSMTL